MFRIFFPFYEHLRRGSKSGSVLTSTTVHTLRQLLPQPQIVQRSSEFTANMPTILRGQTTIPQVTPASIQSYSGSTNFPRANTSSTIRPMVPTANVARLSRPVKPVGNPYAIVVPTRPLQYPPRPPQQQLQSISAVPSIIRNSTNTGKE